MNEKNTTLHQNASAAPQSVDDLIALAKQIRAEFALIRGHMEGIIGQAIQKRAA